MCSELCYSWHPQVRGNECKCSCTISVTSFRNHILEAKDMFEYWITVMTLNCTYLVMCTMNHYVLTLRKTYVQHHLALSSHLYHCLLSVLLSYTFQIQIYSKYFLLSLLWYMSHPFHYRHSVSSTNHEISHYQIFSASSLTYNIMSPNITVLSYILKYIILQSFPQPSIISIVSS